MAGTFQRRLLVPLVSAAAALACWITLPGGRLDRAAFDGVCRGFANPPFFVTGEGSRENPWSLRTFAAAPRTDAADAPLIVSLGDDPEGVFQSSPPSPIDMAVVLTNFHRLGVKQAAVAAVLAWDQPDPIGLMALEKALGRFDSLAMATPLARGAVPDLMPPAYRRASIPIERVSGDTSGLPVVNRIPIRGLILGGERTAAGFQTLDSEKPGGPPPLLAVWEDRVVLAFPLVVVMQRLGLEPGHLEIRLGEYLKLGADGPTLPMDRFGRLLLPARGLRARPVIAAESLIDAREGLIPADAPRPVILRDDRSDAEPSTRAFSAALAGRVAMIASDSGLSDTEVFKRLSTMGEGIALALVVAAMGLLGNLRPFRRHIGFLVVAAVCVAAQFLAAGMGNLWLPGLAGLAAVLAAFVTARHRPAPPRVGKAPAVAPVVPEPAAVPPADVTEPPVSRQPDAPKKKEPVKPARKEPAKKAPAKKAPAKKAARKSGKTRK